MGTVPDGLLGGKLGRFDPVGHQRAAGRVAHSLHVTVDEPEGADIINNKEINIDYLIPGMAIMVICIIIGYIKYSRKDISA
jgi:hypothetical protein